MGHAYTIRKEERLVIEVWVGKITKNELLEHERKHIKDPDLPSAPRVLIDITAAHFDPAIGNKEIEEFVDLYREHRDKTAGAKVAVVAEQEFQIAKKYESKAMRLAIDVIVFNEIDNACTWLGVNMREAQQWIHSKRVDLLSSSISK